MFRSILDGDRGLPRSIPLFRHLPTRRPFPWRPWRPASVRSPEDLPPYLILGGLDPASFVHSPEGWSAVWRGAEPDTRLELSYRAAERVCEARRTWRGLGGGFARFPAGVPLDRAVLPWICAEFPDAWDRAAKDLLERDYQLTVCDAPREAGFCGMPDGPFRLLAVPVAAGALRTLRDRLAGAAALARVPYPVSAEARLFVQAVSFVEGKASPARADPRLAFLRSLAETDTLPFGLPVREAAHDGSAAWTLRREIYVVLVAMPFAGLADFVARMATYGASVRRADDSPEGIEMQPFVMPVASASQIRRIVLWDRERTTRSLLQLAGEVPQRPARENGDIGEAAEAEGLLATAERAGVEAAIWHAAMAEGGEGPSVH